MSTQKYTRYFAKYYKYCLKQQPHRQGMILNGGEHGEHDDHVPPHPISQRQHGFGRKLP